jgi:hypothetical protein
MSEWTSESSSVKEPVPSPFAESSPGRAHGRAVRRVGSLRVPLTLHVRPRATLYRLPDGRTVWCLRLWEEDGPIPRCVSTPTFRAFARTQRLPELTAAIDRLARRAAEVDVDP